MVSPADLTYQPACIRHNIDKQIHFALMVKFHQIHGTEQPA